MNIKTITAAHLRRAADIKDEITTLQQEFDGYFSEQPAAEQKQPKITRWTPERLRKFKRTMRLKREGKL